MNTLPKNSIENHSIIFSASLQFTFFTGVRSLLIDHLCDAKLLDYRSDAIDSRHPCNINADNEEVVKAALLLGLGDRVCRVQKGCIIKGAIKPDEVVIANE